MNGIHYVPRVARGAGLGFEECAAPVVDLPERNASTSVQIDDRPIDREHWCVECSVSIFLPFFSKFFLPSC